MPRSWPGAPAVRTPPPVPSAPALPASAPGPAPAVPSAAQPAEVRRPPAPAPTASAPARTPSPALDPLVAEAKAELEDDDDDEGGDDDGYDDEPASRWVGLLATIGTALIGIVSIQVLASLAEGLMLKKGERVGIPDDLLHRIGYPFGGLGATALVFLVLGVVLVSMPSVLDELISESQDRLVGVALIVAIVMGVLIAIGSLLAVRANLHEYAAKGVSVPSYVRVQFTNFLLGSLGAAALALFGSITAINERGRERAT